MEAVHFYFSIVRVIGLEPTRRKTPDPKSGASTNFATRAIDFVNAKIAHFSKKIPLWRENFIVASSFLIPHYIGECYLHVTVEFSVSLQTLSKVQQAM